MLIDERCQHNHYIELFDTIIRNNNLGYKMIEKYESQFKVNLVPKEIIPSSAKYWAKVLSLCYKDIETGETFIVKKKIDEYIEYNDLNLEDLSWKHLFERAVDIVIDDDDQWE